MDGTVQLRRYGFYRKRNGKDTWGFEPPGCANTVIKGTIAELGNVPAQYKVSQERRLEE